MRFASRIALVLFSLAALLSAAAPTTAPATRPAPAGDPNAIRFMALQVFIDSGDKPLGAYQFEITARTGQVALSGLEGGDHPAFNPAPYYDQKALLNNRVIVAAFSLNADLPRGKSRVATLHVHVTGPVEPEYNTHLQAAASEDGKPIDAKITVVPVYTPVPEGVRS